MHIRAHTHIRGCSICSIVTLCSLVGEEDEGGQETEAVRSNFLIEGVTAVSPPRLSQPPRSARGKYSNTHHGGESGLFYHVFFGILYGCMEGILSFDLRLSSPGSHG